MNHVLQESFRLHGFSTTMSTARDHGCVDQIICFVEPFVFSFTAKKGRSWSAKISRVGGEGENVREGEMRRLEVKGKEDEERK